MTREETIKALGLMEHVESIVATYEPGEIRDDTTVRELKEACRSAIAALRAQQEPNLPLTLEELREMDGEPVWVKCLEPDMGHLSCWGIRNFDCVDGYHTNYCDTDYGRGWLAYRRKPEEEIHAQAEPATPSWAEHLRARFLKTE